MAMAIMEFMSMLRPYPYSIVSFLSRVIYCLNPFPISKGRRQGSVRLQ